MAPFRPSNLNKRAYPGNGSIIGPTTEPSVGISTDDLYGSVNVCDACVGPLPLLGCTHTHCYCPCCDSCRKCLCTTCTPSVPSGMWRTSEQRTAISGGCWGAPTTTCGAETEISCTNVGGADVSANCTNCYGYLWCKSDTYYYFAAPSNTEVSKTWWDRSDAITCANNVCGSQGWYIPPYGELLNARSCKEYWFEGTTEQYWSDTAFSNVGGYYVRMQGGFFLNNGDCIMCVRAFRKTSV